MATGSIHLPGDPLGSNEPSRVTLSTWWFFSARCTQLVGHCSTKQWFLLPKSDAINKSYKLLLLLCVYPVIILHLLLDFACCDLTKSNVSRLWERL